MLFQAVVIFLPILNFFKFHVKGERSIYISLFRRKQPVNSITVILFICEPRSMFSALLQYKQGDSGIWMTDQKPFKIRGVLKAQRNLLSDVI